MNSTTLPKLFEKSPTDAALRTLRRGCVATGAARCHEVGRLDFGIRITQALRKQETSTCGYHERLGRQIGGVSNLPKAHGDTVNGFARANFIFTHTTDTNLRNAPKPSSPVESPRISSACPSPVTSTRNGTFSRHHRRHTCSRPLPRPLAIEVAVSPRIVSARQPHHPRPPVSHLEGVGNKFSQTQERWRPEPITKRGTSAKPIGGNKTHTTMSLFSSALSKLFGSSGSQPPAWWTGNDEKGALEAIRNADAATINKIVELTPSDVVANLAVYKVLSLAKMAKNMGDEKNLRMFLTGVGLLMVKRKGVVFHTLCYKDMTDLGLHDDYIKVSASL